MECDEYAGIPVVQPYARQVISHKYPEAVDRCLQSPSKHVEYALGLGLCHALYPQLSVLRALEELG